MKTKVVFLLCMILAVIAFGQNAEQKFLAEINVTPPKFPAVNTVFHGKNIESIDDYLKHNIDYPNEAVNHSLQGTEVVQFVVTSTGELTNLNVINSICPEIDKEVIRVLKFTSGQWMPASVNGIPVAMTKEVSLVFKLHESGSFVPIATSYFNQGNKKLFVDKNPRKALKYYDKGIMLLPNEESLLITRGLCKFELGDEEGAIADWNRIKSLSDEDKGHLDPNYLAQDLHRFRGFSEMKRITQK